MEEKNWIMFSKYISKIIISLCLLFQNYSTCSGCSLANPNVDLKILQSFMLIFYESLISFALWSPYISYDEFYFSNQIKIECNDNKTLKNCMASWMKNFSFNNWMNQIDNEFPIFNSM